MIPAALQAQLRAAGAVWDRDPFAAAPTSFGDPSAERRALREAAGMALLHERSVIRIGGTDRFTWLQGMVSNDVRPLQSEPGPVQACVLDATGHTLADVRLLATGDHVLADVPQAAAAAVMRTLDLLIVMEDVALDDLADELVGITVQGPRVHAAAHALEGLPGVHTTAADHTGFGGIDVWCPTECVSEAWVRLAAAGARPCGSQAAEALRIEAGIPCFGHEFDAHTLAPEAGLAASHISTAKGCYIGQEVIARIHARGHTNRALTGLVIAGPHIPEPGAAVTDPAAADREVGRVTSAAASDLVGSPIGLALVRHEAREPGHRLQIRTASGVRDAEVTLLPFRAVGA